MKPLIATLLILGGIASPFAYDAIAYKQSVAGKKEAHLTNKQLQAMRRDYPLHVPAGSVENAFAR